MSDDLTETGSTDLDLAELEGLTERQLIMRSARRSMMTHTVVMKMQGDFASMQGEIETLTEGFTELSGEMADVTRVISPNKIKDPDAKGMLDVDRDHEYRLEALEGSCLGLKGADSLKTGVAPYKTEKPKGPVAVLLSGLTPQQQLVGALIVVACLGGGASAERVISALMGTTTSAAAPAVQEDPPK